MGYFMYVCPECRKVFKVQGNDKKVKCSNCANILKDMRVAVEEWEVMDKAQREDLKSRMCMPEEEPVILMEEEPVPEEVRPAKPVEREGKICPKCGCMNPVSSKFCNECGFDMNAPKPQENKPKSVQSSFSGSFFDDFDDKAAGTSNSFVSSVPEKKEIPDVSYNNYNVSTERSGHSKLSIIALILGLLGCTSIIGLILAIVDLAKSKDDDYKHVCSWICVGFTSFWFIVGVALGVTKGSYKKEIAGTKPITESSAQAGEDTSSDVNDQEMEETTEAASETETSTETAAPGTTIDEQVLIDDNGVKVTAVEYVTDSIWGDGIKLLIENDTSSDIGVGCDALIVNDYMITDLFSATVAAGKKANEVMYLLSSELRAAGIENVGQIEIYMHTFDADSYSTIKNFPCSVIKTSAYDNMDMTVNDEGKELYNGDGVRIVGKYVDENSFWGAAVLLYIENTSGRNVTVHCDDLSINGFMITPYFSSTIYDGKKAIDDITLLSSELEQNGITSIDDIELKFRIVDSESYSTIKETDVISFSAK